MGAGEHAHGEEFPREETAALVGAALLHEQRRWKIQVALVAVGVSALVLGLPTRSFCGLFMTEIWPTARGEWTGMHLVPTLVARASTALTGWRAHQAWYVVAALATGCTAVVLLGAARRHGATPLRAIFLTLIVLSVPAAWLAATIPNAASCELLGAAWLFSALDHDHDERWTRRATIAFIGASLLHAWNVYLWPAYAIALFQKRRTNLALAFGALVLVPAIVLGAWHIEHPGEEWQSSLGGWWRAMLASGSGGWGPLIAWSVLWPLGVGVGTFGILRFLWVTFMRPERRPPAWMFLFAAVPLAVLGLGGFIGFDVPWLWLVPIAFLGLQDLAFLQAWVLIVVSAVGIVCVRAIDIPDHWYNLVVFHVRPDDLVIAGDLEHEDRLRAMHIDVIQVDDLSPTSDENSGRSRQQSRERIEQARAAHRRIVIDLREPRDILAESDEWIRLDEPAAQSLREQGAVDLIDLDR